MPIYEYRCSKCGKTFEALQSIKAGPVRTCPHCRGRANKIVSVSSFQLKGKGWYITDYKGGPAGEKKSAPAKKKDEGKDKNASTN